jgi:hypothetical protein
MLAVEARRTTDAAVQPSKRLSTLFRLMHVSNGLRGLKLIAEETNGELMDEVRKEPADTRKKMQDNMQDNWKHLPDTLRYACWTRTHSVRAQRPLGKTRTI